MELNDILNALQYSNSPNFLAGTVLESDRDFGHSSERHKRSASSRSIRPQWLLL